MIFHITSKTAWATPDLNSYAPESLAEEGFMHCSRWMEIIESANRYYHGRQDLLLLCIDESQCDAPLKYEAPTSDRLGLFPHLYGPLNRTAVVRVIELPCLPSGDFSLPTEAIELARNEFFTSCWKDFCTMAPQAAAIRQLLLGLGETVVNDHVAFRTFDRGPIRLETLEPILLSLGYTVLDEYYFDSKHLRARAYLCTGSPRIFLSELLVDELSDAAAQCIQSLLSAIPANTASPHLGLLYRGCLWPAISQAEYELLSRESEYAGWLAAHGLHANHFTISINHLHTLDTPDKVLDFVETAGFQINNSGGRVKGTQAEKLQQGSTMADTVSVEFQDGPKFIPGCYYEFALRHRDAEGVLYEGFVPASADRIFESTHRS